MDLAAADLTEIFTDPSGTTYIDFKRGIRFHWWWTGDGENRVLNVQFVKDDDDLEPINLPPPRKSAIQNWCNTNFGTGKVVIV
jgi:hypothetical protein